MDETHGVFVFDDPFDELSLREALCGGRGGGRKQRKMMNLRLGEGDLTRAGAFLLDSLEDR